MKLYIRLYIVFLWLGCAYFANLYKTIVNMYNHYCPKKFSQT